MKNRRKLYQIFGLIIGMIGIILMFKWYDWKMCLIIFLLLWSNNISHSAKHRL